jgi:hypothetical protein
MAHRGIAFVVALAAFVAVMLFAGMSASAAIVTMDYTGAEGNNSGGVYVYPYDFTIDSSSSTSELMCDDFTHQISTGDTWTANTLNVSDLNAGNVTQLEFPSAGVTGYLEAAYLFVEEVNAFNASNSDPDGLYNWATWDLLTNSDVSSVLSPTDEAQVQIDLNAVEALGGTLTPSQFSNVTIYTPTDMSSTGPQEFMGYNTGNIIVPEPCAFALLGVGAIGLLARRKRTQK